MLISMLAFKFNLQYKIFYLIYSGVMLCATLRKKKNDIQFPSFESIAFRKRVKKKYSALSNPKTMSTNHSSQFHHTLKLIPRVKTYSARRLMHAQWSKGMANTDKFMLSVMSVSI